MTSQQITVALILAAAVLALVREWREERRHQRRMQRLSEWIR